MPSYIRCDSCACLIGIYYDFIDQAQAIITKEKIYGKDSEHSKFDPDKVIFEPSITPTLEPLFDALQIANRCCRMHITSRTNFDGMYK
jgi:DNA-directed RNA polymerase subunit N (RpoN/RPB10)